MAYSKQTWDTTSYVNPTRMNHIEDGIEASDTPFETVTTTSGTWQIQKIGKHLAICYITINKDRTFASAYGNFYFATGEEIILPQLGQSLVLGVTAQRISTGVGGCIVYKGNQYFNLNKVTLNVFNGKNETINDDDVSLIVTFYIP